MYVPAGSTLQQIFSKNTNVSLKNDDFEVLNVSSKNVDFEVLNANIKERRLRWKKMRIAGFEPTTYGFGIHCSANWPTYAIQLTR